MTWRRTLLALSAVVLLIAGACADDKVVSDTTTRTSVDFERDPGAPGATAASSPSASGGTGRGRVYSAADPPPAGFREADLAVTGDVPLTARIEPGCVEHGQTLRITARSRKGSHIRMNVVYPNGEFKDLPTHAATAGGGGTVEWSLKVTESAKVGVARVQISSRSDDADEQGTTGTWDTVVAAPGGCQA